MSKNISDYTSSLVDYFISGDKSENVHTLGVEIEHIIVYSDSKETVPYAGQMGIAYILHELASFYPDAIIERGDPLLGFFTDKFTITLEPGAQLEISIYPYEKLESIHSVYTRFRNNLKEILTPLNMECLTIGYQPKTLVEDIPLIPKERYKYMDKYFKTSGNHGINMMRGTASTQVSIDYYNEKDFVKKYRCAYVLSPYLKLISDNCPYFEGEINNDNLLRSKIWEDVDSSRCDIPNTLFNDDFGFKDYAEYILQTPTIFLPPELNNGDYKYTDSLKSFELMEDEPSREFIEHILSMVFPDVRLKKYIEIRMADSLPEDKMIGYVAMIKGLLYNENAHNYIESLIKDKNITKESIIETTHNLEINSWNGQFYGIPVKEIHTTFLNFASEALSDNEKEYLNIWK